LDGTIAEQPGHARTEEALHGGIASKVCTVKVHDDWLRSPVINDFALVLET
jgi:hypothetical protein